MCAASMLQWNDLLCHWTNWSYQLSLELYGEGVCLSLRTALTKSAFSCGVRSLTSLRTRGAGAFAVAVPDVDAAATAATAASRTTMRARRRIARV
jgi:hypothetical protein